MKIKKHKYKIINPIRFYTFVALCFLSFTLIFFGIFNTLKVNAASEDKYVNVTVQENDTIWNIIYTYNPNADIDMRKALSDIYKINNIDNAELMPGDEIIIPIYD